MADWSELDVRLECLRLAHGNSNRATALVPETTPEAVVTRARIYADFVFEQTTGKIKR